MRCATPVFVFLFLSAAVLFGQETTGSAPSPSIAEIQGAGHVSAFHREEVQGVEGLVTAVAASGRGFYMESNHPDNDPATSEGIYVEGYRLPALSPGDLVRVSGRVEEFYPGGPSSGNLPITRIRRAEVGVVSVDNALPAPVIIGRSGRMPPTETVCDDADGLVENSPFDPENDAIDFYESLEGMRVQINDAVSVGTVHTAYGEIWVLADGGAGASVRTHRGGIVLREGDFNPERILIDYLEEPSIATQDPVVLPLVGDVFTAPIVGVVSYSYGNYKVRPVGQLPAVTPRNLPRESAAVESDPAVLSVAAFNVYNLSAHDEARKFDDIAATIVDALVRPDIVILSEVQDGDGSRSTDLVSSERTANRLLQAISSAGGGGEYRYVDIAPERNRDGGQPGGNIRVGFLFRSDRVRLVERPGGDATTAGVVRSVDGQPEIDPNPTRIDPDNRAFSGSRKPLAAEFEFRGQTLVVIGNHFNSKGGDGYVFGHIQPPNFPSEVKRSAQAEVVRTFVEQIVAVDPDAFVVVAGDLNDFAFSPPLRVLSGSDRVLVDLAEELLPEREIYSYIYEGNSQALDHIFASRGLVERGDPTVEYVHRYSEYLYGERQSDHDPVLARFRLE